MPREPSHPPSEPKPSNPRGRVPAFAPDDRPLRLQLIGALLVGLLLVACGLYVWHRPRAIAEGQLPDAGTTLASWASPDGGVADSASEAAPVRVSEPRVLGCHDRGPTRTAPEACDRLPAVEQALTRAALASASCMAPSAVEGTIEYVADVSFSRRKVKITLPRAGRSLTERKLVLACGAAVREALASLPLDGIEHQHARYAIAVTATYHGKS